MAEFLIIFVITLVIISLLAIAMHFGKPPVHRPSREDILLLLQNVESGEARPEEWDMFLGYPLHFDPELENVRQKCLALEEGTDSQPPIKQGIGNYIYDKAGREQIHQLSAELKKLIDNSPKIREF